MDTDRLRYFTTVARTENLHRAAELLHVTVPALSKAIKTLEAELGLRLVAPSGRGLVLTDEGRRVARESEEILRRLRDLSLPGTPAAAPVRLGSFEVFTSWLLRRVAPALPGGAAVEIHELIPGRLEEALAERRIDLGVTFLPVPDPRIEFIRVATARSSVYGLARFERMAFAGLPFAVPLSPVEGAPTRVRGLDGWPDDRIARSIAYRVTLLESALELCRQGRAVAYLPDALVSVHNRTVLPEYRLRRLDAPKAAAAPQAVHLVKRKSDPEGPLARAVARALRQAFPA